MTDLMKKLKEFEESQTATFESHQTQLSAFSAAAESAVQGLDAKLSNAVAGTRADAQTEFNAVNVKLEMMNTFCAGVKAEVQVMIAHVSAGGGGKGSGFG